MLQRFVLETYNPDPALGVRWPEFIGGALASIARRESIGGACRMVLSGVHTLTKFVRTPTVKKASRAQIVKFEAQQSIPCPLADLVWDHLCLGDDGTELELMLVAVKRNVVEPVCAAAAAADFPVGQILPTCLALIHAFRYNYPEVRDSALVISAGARSTHFVFLEGERFFARTVALGGNIITQMVADELRIEFAAAEVLKVQGLTDRTVEKENLHAAGTVQWAARSFVGRLQLEIMRSLASNRRHNGTPAQPAAVYLAGGGSLIPDLPALRAEKLKVHVERYDALRNVELSAAVRAAGTASTVTLPPELIGLAASAGLDERWLCNLLPPTLARARNIRQRQPYLLATAVLAIAALLPVIAHYQALVPTTAENRAVLDHRLQPLQALAARNVGNLARLESARARIAALQGAVAMKSNWMIFLGDLQSRLVEVEDVWLERLQILPAPVAGERKSASAQTLHLNLSGRLLDFRNPLSKVSPDSYRRVKKLLQRFSQSEFVAAVASERFDNAQPGILRFDCTLVINPRRPL